ncbi:MAG: PQQ-binding-like beta-propeller repeat protein [Alphaproteobacteria bacterium]|nr:PQQ-binding-like beta-propeller repeat protein [Alphaproteobacteria bacterium]
MWPRRAGLAVLALLLALPALSARADARPMDTSQGEWPVYGGDLGSRKYAPLDQIDAQSVRDLEIAWIWASSDNPRLTGPDPLFIDNNKGTPLMVGGVLYFRTGLGMVAAVDALTGRSLWVFDHKRYLRERPISYGFTTRGLAYWEDPETGAGRLVFVTSDRKLMMLDALTGSVIRSFGEEGMVDLDRTLRNPPPAANWISYTAPPVIVRDRIIIGNVVADPVTGYLDRSDPMARPRTPPGDIRAFDVRTGDHLWTFHTVPEDGEFGADSWGEGSNSWVGMTNVWSMMSADAELGYVYAPVTAPAHNHYGGFRPGDNLFGQSLVCIDVETGERVWHFQTIHHPIFDYDLPAAPVLADLTVDGRQVKAVIQVTKTGFAFVFDRVTGEPLWPIEERPVPPSTIEGELASPTQPFPTRPPPFAEQGLREDNLLSLTPALAAKTRAFLKGKVYGPIFTPLAMKPTFLSPGVSGGANWPGGAFDPHTQRFYVTAMNEPHLYQIVEAPMFWRYGLKIHNPKVDGLPVVDPPWATITAIDMNAGELLWQVPNGEGPRRRADLAPLGLGYLGTPAKSNAMVTKSLLFAASTGLQVEGEADLSRVRVSPSVDRGLLAEINLGSKAVFRAYDKETGAIVWEHPIGPSFNDGGAPMTYMAGGRQFVVTPTGGRGLPAYWIAFALPAAEKGR